ncbi:glycogen synthase [Patescibacteria group bacterium]
MRILYAADEAYPLFKIGGLGDVAGTLPKELKNQATDISIIIPGHPEISLLGQNWTEENSFNVNYDNEDLRIKIVKGLLPETNIPVFLVQENKYISQKTDASDNHADKFTVFSFAVSKWLSLIENKFDIIHLNDWHTALIPVISAHIYEEKEQKYLLTIHNLMYQGATSTPILQKLRLPKEKCHILKWDSQDDHINILLEGLLHVDAINTVSKNYVKEILTSEYGERIEKIIKTRKRDLFGILNGLDTTVFDPKIDKHIYQNFDVNTHIEGKKNNKSKLQQELRLEQDTGKVLLGFVGRVDPGQKGVQLIIEALNQRKLISDNLQFVFLGTGDPDLETQLHQVSQDRRNVRVITRYDEPLAAKIYAASDLFIIPSRFEPCGLIQLIAMKYGSIPIARSTGGLKDTIRHQETGFLFNEYSTEAMVNSLNEAIETIKNENTKNEMITRGMRQDFSWVKSAKEYISLYKKILENK